LLTWSLRGASTWQPSADGVLLATTFDSCAVVC
jgi:hypothetical protein